MADAIYSIGALARMLDVSPTTLRSWEERYGVVVPDRSAGAQRLYSRDQLEQLRFVCEQIKGGLSAADAHRVLAQQIEGGGVVHSRSPTNERSIVLLERDPYAAELAEYFLRTEGYAVTTARSAQAAEAAIAEAIADLAIIDLMIDGGAGLRLCAKLAHDVHVLAVSAIDQRDRALEAGADAFLRKPFESLTLVSAARDLIGTSAVVRAATPMPLGS